MVRKENRDDYELGQFHQEQVMLGQPQSFPESTACLADLKNTINVVNLILRRYLAESLGSLWAKWYKIRAR